VIVIQVAPLVAVQEQPVPAVTLTLPVPPTEATEAVAGEIPYVQAAPAWVTVKVWPPIVIVPGRELVLVFAATE
jgi:hypothetical protein